MKYVVSEFNYYKHIVFSGMLYIFSRGFARAHIWKMDYTYNWTKRDIFNIPGVSD